MKIFVTGTRGIPDIPGGVEKHCQELYPRISAKGYVMIVATRSSYVRSKSSEWKGVKLVKIYSPRQKSLEAIIHTFLSLIRAWFFYPDIVHIHAVGPSLLTPMARLMGFRVVITNHGPEYDRQKWGKIAKMVLKIGEKVGGTFANEVIVISSVIKDIVKRRCKRDSNLIYNGVTFPKINQDTDYLDRIGVVPGKYILSVARFVPEKGLHDLIEAFEESDLDYQLVIAGGADHETNYSRNLKRMAAEDQRIILTGYITGEPLKQVFTHARLFVLPSYHEGLPISLLEAMSYGLPVLVSNIPANKEIDLPSERYFRCGNLGDLKCKLDALSGKTLAEEEKILMRNLLLEKYNWEKIADQTIKVYQKAVGQRIKDRGYREE